MAESGAGRGPGSCWYLRRCGGTQESLLLQDGQEITIGRGLDVTYQLKSTASPLMISRVHCILKQNSEGQWTITDNQSLNGVWKNNEKLEPLKAYVLSEEAHIQVGVPLPGMEKAEFEYKVIRERMDQVAPVFYRPLPGKSKSSRTKRKYNYEEVEASGTDGPSISAKAKCHRVSKEGEGPAKSQQSSALSKQPTRKLEYGVNVDQCELNDFGEGEAVAATQQLQSRSTLQLSKVRMAMEEIRRLNVQMQEKQMEMQEKLSAPHESKSTDSKDVLTVQKELHELQNQLSNEREEHIQSMQELKQIFQEEQQKMGDQKQAEEEHLKEQLAQALQEHTLLMEELNRNKNDFEQIIQAKNKELQETLEEKEKVRAQKEEVISHMNDVLDNELQCIICSEHFIEAVTLNCAHSFCSFCIKSWRKRKEECPICRQAISSQTRSLVLDNCINSMVDKLSPEMKNRRAALILERKGEKTLLKQKK
ncbi:E3 ubiquitin-protein ligase RNF8 [Rhinophrynus dorsalis]